MADNVFGFDPEDYAVPRIPEQTAAPSLINMLQQIQRLQAQPVVPQNPLTGLAQMGGAWVQGMQGLARNPIEVQFQRQRDDQMSSLLNQAKIMQTIAEIQGREQAEKRREEREERLEMESRRRASAAVASDLFKSDDPIARKMALQEWNRLGLTQLSPEAIETISTAADSKVLKERMTMAASALRAGIDPRKIGMNVGGINVDELAKMDEGQLDTLLGTDYKTKAADLFNKQLEAQKTQMEIKKLEKEIAGEIAPKPAKTVDEYAVKLIEQEHQKPGTLEAPKREWLRKWEASKSVKGVDNKVELAMAAAGGDEKAKAALALLNTEEKALTQYAIIDRANRVKERMAMDPNYQPTLEEKIALRNADTLMEKSGQKPMTPQQEKVITSGREVFRHLDNIKDIMATGKAGDYVGPVYGNVGYYAEKVGMTDPNRAQLYKSLNGLLLEIGPEKFGSAFSAGEQRILFSNLPNVTDPIGQFQVKMKDFDSMVRAKYDDWIKIIKSQKRALPEDFETSEVRPSVPSGGGGGKPSMQDVIRQLLQQGKNRQQIKDELKKRGY